MPVIEEISNRERRSGMRLETLFDTVLPLAGAVLCSLARGIILAGMAWLAVCLFWRAVEMDNQDVQDRAALTKWKGGIVR